MTPGLPKPDEVPDDAGIASRSDGALARHGAIAWGTLGLAGLLCLLVLSGTVGASLVDRNAELGPPGVVLDVDATPTVAVVAGDYAVGVAVTETDAEILFGATDRPLPPPG